MRRLLVPAARRISDVNLLARSVLRRDADLTMPPVVGPPAEPVLVIAPHADDESIGCGGVLALADQASVVLLTGDKQRRGEAAEALGVLGITDLLFLAAKDQRVSEASSLAQQIADAVVSRSAATVFLPYPLDRHRDHVAAARAVAAASLSCELWCYEVWTPLDPNRLVDITSVCDVKREAIKCHRSQVEGHAYADAALGLNQYRALVVPPATHAEAFLSVTNGELRRLLGGER
jgi:LmbE family N-acetylglucosaminyl deacetylase